MPRGVGREFSLRAPAGAPGCNVGHPSVEIGRSGACRLKVEFGSHHAGPGVERDGGCVDVAVLDDVGDQAAELVGVAEALGIEDLLL